MKWEMKIIKSELIDVEGKEFYRTEMKNMTDGLNKDTTLAFIFEQPQPVGIKVILILEGGINI
jgi:hypothetical protein